MGLEKINDYKKLKGYTNKMLSELTGISISSLDKITSGENTNPKLGTIRLICKALDCNMDDLLGDENDSTIVSNEIDMIKKYRRLDPYGKDMVNTVLNKELARTIEQHKKSNKEEKPYISFLRELVNKYNSNGEKPVFYSVDESNEYNIDALSSRGYIKIISFTGGAIIIRPTELGLEYVIDNPLN